MTAPVQFGPRIALNEDAEAARTAGKTAVDPETRAEHEDWYRQAAAGIALNAGRSGRLQQKRHALATRMQDREAGGLRFARDLRVPFSNSAAEQSIRMCKLGIKISGCMRSVSGAGEFCAVRSCPATAARHGIGALEALTLAFQGPALDLRNRVTRPSPQRQITSGRIRQGFHARVAGGASSQPDKRK